MGFILFVLAIVIGVYGILQITRGEPVIGVLLIVLACMVGPGGYSIFK